MKRVLIILFFISVFILSCTLPADDAAEPSGNQPPTGNPDSSKQAFEPEILLNWYAEHKDDALFNPAVASEKCANAITRKYSADENRVNPFNSIADRTSYFYLANTAYHTVSGETRYQSPIIPASFEYTLSGTLNHLYNMRITSEEELAAFRTSLACADNGVDLFMSEFTYSEYGTSDGENCILFIDYASYTDYWSRTSEHELAFPIELSDQSFIDRCGDAWKDSVRFGISATSGEWFKIGQNGDYSKQEIALAYEIRYRNKDTEYPVHAVLWARWVLGEDILASEIFTDTYYLDEPIASEKYALFFSKKPASVARYSYTGSTATSLFKFDSDPYYWAGTPKDFVEAVRDGKPITYLVRSTGFTYKKY